jgi:hypothetical protein
MRRKARISSSAAGQSLLRWREYLVSSAGWESAIAERLYTLTLWEDPETIRQLTASAQHKAAVRQVFEANYGTAMHTGVWVPDHLSPQWRRCPECGTMIDPDRSDQSCGELPPARRTYI